MGRICCEFRGGNRNQRSSRKAHATAEDLARGRSTWWQKTGNEKADSWAKAGAKLHGLEKEIVSEHFVLHSFAEESARYLGLAAPRQQTGNTRTCKTTEAHLPTWELEMVGEIGRREIVNVPVRLPQASVGGSNHA